MAKQLFRSSPPPAKAGPGRPAKAPAIVADDVSPEEFLRKTLAGEIDPTQLQIRTAIALMNMGRAAKAKTKKEALAAAAAEAAAPGSRFAPAAPPLKVVGGS